MFQKYFKQVMLMLKFLLLNADYMKNITFLLNFILHGMQFVFSKYFCRAITYI